MLQCSVHSVYRLITNNKKKLTQPVYDAPGDENTYISMRDEICGFDSAPANSGGTRPAYLGLHFNHSLSEVQAWCCIDSLV